ncbi:MAG: biotin--[acetyl-CoA-carboxylase] ligase [Candidatus Bathyarchaeota archaeon]|nr:biotin--[acetyl-CoA-carboxylase] ligase [Candidatus Bathyarchaeota archaeon]MDH5787966.1 biotin--[acetyl-CoA-carboxylase] ligase [Candidatus Bathyarchaeota archaeon]
MDKLRKSLRTIRFGRRIFFCREVGSTNDWAKELAELGAVEGTVTIAETQTCGRGRLGRQWISPKGGLWISIILRPQLKPAEATKLVFAVGLATAEVLRELYGLEAETKWPNDVLVNGRKICGILTEMKTSGNCVNHVVMGIGINANFSVGKVFSEELRKAATSLEEEIGRKIKLERLFSFLIERIESVYDLYIKEGFAVILKKWKKHASFLGHAVEVVSETERLHGLARDVDLEGALILRLENGKIKRVFVGDVSLRTR